MRHKFGDLIWQWYQTIFKWLSSYYEGKMNEITVLMSIYENDNPNYFIEAVQSNFEQSFRPKELVLVIDGRIPQQLEQAIETVKSLYKKQIRIIRLKRNSGLGIALQEGLKHVQTNLVARADADDISDHKRFENQVVEFTKNPRLIIVGGLVKEFVGNVNNITSARKLPNTDEKIRRFAKFRSPFNHPTVMFKKNAVLNVGNYQEFKSFEDYHLWMRLLKSDGLVKNINNAIVFMRTDTGMYSRRGGISYCLRNLKLRWYFMEIGSISFIDMLFVDTIIIVSALIPTIIRVKLYKMFLRKQ